jgi:N-acetyl-anhydromuramyl-L-alanine amidase AmpD
MSLRSVDLVVVHHTAGPTNATVEQIRRGHRARGFSDIGYHAVIYGDGSLHRGRPEERVGSHARGANRGSLGVSVCGNFQNAEPAQSQLSRLVYVLAYWCQKYGVATDNIKGHRNVGTTATVCPGNNLYKHLPAIRRAVRQLLASDVVLGWPASA